MWEYILMAVVVLLVVLFFVFKKREKTPKHDKPVELNAKIEGITINRQYLPTSMNDFLHAIYEILPNDICVAYPFVRASKIFNYIGNKENVKNLLTEVVDVCIFLKETSMPILVVDLVDFSLQNAGLREQKQELVKVFQSAGLPYVKVMTLESYDLSKLKSTMASALPKSLAVSLNLKDAE